jgi:hypothetical protein
MPQYMEQRNMPMQTLPVLQNYEVVIWGERKDVPLHRIGVQAFSEDEAKEDVMRRWRSSSPDAISYKVSRVEVLSDVHLDTARKQHTLFEDLADQCIGHSMADVQGAAVNLLLTVVQRNYIKQSDAEARWNELAGRGLEALKRRFSGRTDDRDKAAETEIARRLGA